MKLNFNHEVLIQRIQRFGVAARDHRQIHLRLEKLLPDRLEELIRKFKNRDRSSSKALRQALASEEYAGCIQEVVELGHQSLEARIQYETHMMLFEARRSLRRTSF